MVLAQTSAESGAVRLYLYAAENNAYSMVAIYLRLYYNPQSQAGGALSLTYKIIYCKYGVSFRNYLLIDQCAAIFTPKQAPLCGTVSAIT